MSDGKVVIETDLDSSGIEKGLSKLGSVATTGLKAATVAIAGTATALGGIATAAIKVGSDFEAQMSRVKAISGATGEEFEKLKAQAIQLGADTAFSSKEAAEGMENLAAAGFATNEIMDAMPGLLDLAAASGEDLATSSDIAASTLRGFGLAASDAGHVADVLAENANRTNSSVYETGEAMKYVAPLARAAGLSMEETAAAIGIMANAGIQGSQAGTTLRGAISRLSKPTKDMKEAMKELGISFYDSDGKMKSLTEQVGMMREATAGLTDEQKNNHLVTLYGQESLSGMLALINEGEGSLNSLTEAYKVCDGSAKQAAETMQDNLQGAIEELGGSAESLGLVFYESVSENMKEAAQSATESINRITDAFENGGLDAAIKAAGDEFATLATEAASHAPEMVDTAVDFIESFAGGIADNKGELVAAAGDMAEAVAGGLADILPDELEKPVDKAVKSVSKSLTSGGLKQAGKTVESTFNNLIKVTGKLADAALPPLTKAVDAAGENLDLIAASAAAAFTAFKGYKVVTTAGKSMEALTATVKMMSAAEKANALQVLAASGALTAKEAIIGVCTGKIKLATAAQMAWNAVMNANPIGLMITAVGALAAGIGIYALVNKDAADTSYELSESQEKVLDSCREVTQAINEERDAREKNVQSIDREYDNYSALVSELQSITDENGRVKAGYEERARVITGELADALGTEISLTDGIIQNYQETIDKIKEVIVQKKAEALLSSMQADMAQAYDKTTEAMDAYKDAAAMVSETNKKVEDATSAVKTAQEMYDASLLTGGDTANHFAMELAKAKENLESAKDAQASARREMESAQSTLNSLSSEVNNYNALMEAMASGEAAKIEAAMTALVTAYQSYTTEALASSEKTRNEMYNQANSFVENMKLVQDGTVQVADSVYQDMARAAIDSINEFSKLPGGIAQGIQDVGPEASAAIASALAQADIDGKLDAEAKAGLDSFISGFSGLDEKTQETWSKAWYGALKGLEGFEELKDPAKDGAEAFLDSLKDALEVHSPSRAVENIFSQVWPGASEGLDEGKSSVIEKGKSVITEFLSALGGESIGEKARGIGSTIMNFFGIGVSSQKGNIDITSKGISDSMNTQLGSADTQSTGFRKTAEYNTGVGSNKGTIDSTSKSMAVSSNEFLGSEDTQGTGSRKTKEYNTGLGSNKGKIDRTSSSIATSSDKLLGSADTGGTGSRKGSEYNRGLGSNSGAISGTSVGLSNTANAGMGSANTGATGSWQGAQFARGVGSQAGAANRAGTNLADSADSGASSVDGSSAGSGFGSGFVSGIRSWIGSAVDAAANLAASALRAAEDFLGINSPSREMKKVGKFFSEGFAIGIEDEEQAVVKSSENIAKAALDAVDLSDISSRMREVMALNTNRISKSITMRSSETMLNRQEISNALSLSDEEIARLANQFGTVAGNTFAGNMDGMKIQAYERELFRIMRRADKT